MSDAAALPEFNALSFTLTSEVEVSALVRTYLTIATPTIRISHRGTVEGWLCELYQTGLLKPSKKAVLLIMMTNDTQYVDSM